ncbi:MAG: hypothetical protein HKN33_02105 [Pyrinomonadaceae bacterium]|nr:hypothetical protein [Pyrinomonadaceae bacterium]
MKRDLFSVLSAIGFGWLLTIVGRFIGLMLSPVPKGANPNLPGYEKILVDAMPLHAWVPVVLSYLFAAIGGGYLIGRYAETETRVFPCIFSAFILLLWISKVVRIPHPVWVNLIVILSFVPLAIISQRKAFSYRNVRN